MPTLHPRNIGSRLELFVDYFLIDSMHNTRLRLHEPREAGVAVKFDSPWDGLFAGCITVLKDGVRYRMYYRGLPRLSGGDGSPLECTCLAESYDGIHWVKPKLGVIDYFDSPAADSNVIIHKQSPASHNFSPFLDTRPGVPESERYKAVAGLHPDGLFIYDSPDGVHWRKRQEKPILTSDQFAFDSVNVLFWSEHENCYVCYFRTWKGLPDWGKAVRWVSRSTSPDLINWTPHEQIDTGDLPLDHLYTQGTRPYFRAPHIYIALAARFWFKKNALTPEQAKAINVVPEYSADCSDAVLLTSRGGNRFERTFLESFIRPGPGYENWTSRTNYPSVGIVPTGPGEISLYCHRHYAQPTAHAARYTLRTDGFVSVNAPYAGGEMVTHTLVFSGRELVLNYATSAAGEVRVELQDASGVAIPGFTLADAVPIFGDEVERTAAWANGPDVGALAGREVRVRFVMKDADLYSMRFK